MGSIQDGSDDVWGKADPIDHAGDVGIGDAFLADVSMLVLGGDLKRREKLSARLGDILSQMYLASAILKRYQDEGRQQADAPLLHWGVWNAMAQAQEAFDGLLANYPSKGVGRFLYRIIFPFGHPYVVPSDEMGRQVAKLLIAPSATRDRLTEGCYIPPTADEPVGALELALIATIAAEPIDVKVREAEKRELIADNPLANVRDMAHAAWQQGVVNAEEYALLQKRDELRDKVVHVDDFPFDYDVNTAAQRHVSATHTAAREAAGN